MSEHSFNVAELVEKACKYLFDEGKPPIFVSQLHQDDLTQVIQAKLASAPDAGTHQAIILEEFRQHLAIYHLDANEALETIAEIAMHLGFVPAPVMDAPADEAMFQPAQRSSNFLSAAAIMALLAFAFIGWLYTQSSRTPVQAQAASSTSNGQATEAIPPSVPVELQLRQQIDDLRRDLDALKAKQAEGAIRAEELKATVGLAIRMLDNVMGPHQVPRTDAPGARKPRAGATASKDTVTFYDSSRGQKPPVKREVRVR